MKLSSITGLLAAVALAGAVWKEESKSGELNANKSVAALKLSPHEKSHFSPFWKQSEKAVGIIQELCVSFCMPRLVASDFVQTAKWGTGFGGVRWVAAWAR